MVVSLADTLYAFRFLKLLTTSWEDTDAYKLGIVDDQGKKLKKPKTQEEKDAYTMFHRLVYNIKRLIGKIPLGQSKIGTYTAALYLIKEETGLDEDELISLMGAAGIEPIMDGQIIESWKQDGDILLPGVYVLEQDICNPTTGEILHLQGTKVSVPESCAPVDTMYFNHIYEVTHQLTNQKIYVTEGDLRR